MPHEMNSDGAPVTLPDVWAGLRRARVAVFFGALAGLLLALGFLALATPFYKAQMIVGPASPMRSQEASTPAERTRMARDTGIDSLNFMRFENTLSGPAVAGILLKDEKIFEGLLQDRPLGLFEPETRWSPEKLAVYIRRHVRILPVGDTPLRRIAYYHPSPLFAAYFTNRLHDVTDELIRRSRRAEATQRVAYLQKAVKTVTNPEHRRALTDLLMEQERLLMLASVDQPYAAVIVEPAASSYRPEWPSKSLIFLSFMLAGGVLGFVADGLRRG